MRQLHAERYDLCISPHRSFRSALLAIGTFARKRVTFDRSAGRFFYTDIVPYRQADHEIVRNLSLLTTIAEGVDLAAGPAMYPSEQDEQDAAGIMSGLASDQKYICIAPGSVWATKRWTLEGFADGC